MGIVFEVKKGGATVISLTEYSIKDFEFTSESSEDLDLQHNKIIKGITISGIINPDSISDNGDGTNIGREVDSVRKLANWAVIPEYLDCYKDINYMITDARGVVVKEDSFVDCYVVEYEESFSDENGTGKFKTVLREKGRMVWA